MANYKFEYRITPTVQASIYTADRMLCAPFLISGLVPPSSSIKIHGITVIDLAGSNPTLDFVFFTKNVTISNGINQTCNVSNAELQANGTLIERVGAATYTAGALGSTQTIASTHPNNLVFSADSSGVLKVAVMVRTTPTPATTSQYTIVFHCESLS